MRIDQYPSIGIPTSGQLVLVTDTVSGANYNVKVGDFFSNLSGSGMRLYNGMFQLWDAGTGGWATLNVFSGNFFLT